MNESSNLLTIPVCFYGKTIVWFRGVLLRKQYYLNSAQCRHYAAVRQ